MRKPLIRLAGPADIPHLISIRFDASQRAFQESFGIDFSPPDATSLGKIWQRRFQRSSQIVFLLEVEDAPVAYAGIALESQGMGRIAGLYVKSCASGRGMGRMLLDTALHFLVKKGCVTCSLEVMEGNLRACRLYKNYGFIYTHEDRVVNLNGRVYTLQKMLKILSD